MTLAPMGRCEDDVRTSRVATDLPPEERLWKRYSPHYELPMSGMSSLMAHLFFLGFLALGALLFARMTSGGGSGPSVGVVAISGAAEAVSSGKSAGVPTGDELIPPSPPPEPNRVREANHEATLEAPKPRSPSILPPGAGTGFQVPQGDPLLNQLNEDTRRKIREALLRQSKPGPDSGAGQPGTGSSEFGVPGARIETKRAKRQLRWTMVFKTRDGNDYLQQLKALKAILAYEDSGGKYLVIRDLSKLPAKGQVEPMDKIDRIYWIDDRPQSVRSLARALGIPTPKKLVAFFPAELEKEMARRELDYAGRKEEDIRETKFTVVQTLEGYEPRVESQSPEN